MFRPSDGSPPLSPSDVLRNPSNWIEISRGDAVAAAGSRRVVVVSDSGSAGRAEWFDLSHPLFRAMGPQSLRGVRYYRYRDRAQPHGVLAHGVQTGAAESPPPPAEKKTPVREKTWIELELLTEEGVPVPHERYLVKVPDGTTQSGSTDKKGRARIDGIDPGGCEISFPEIDARAWREG